MFRSTLLVAVTALAAVANAQNYSTSGNLSIDATQIQPALRQSWCRGQMIACPQICGGRASANTCDSENLTYNCVCPDNEPRNISDYTQTLPFFICEQWKTNCVASHPDDLDGQAGCQSVTCGSMNATEAESSNGGGSSTTSAAASMTSSPSGTSGAGGASGASMTSATSTPTPTESGSAAALSIAQNYGTGLFALLGMAVFGIAM
ncbi:hypothetical protein SMMN14_07937 [Sphaerulina musiva]